MSEAQSAKNEIDRDTPIAVVMRRWPATVTVLVQRKMACAGCALSPFCTIADVARDYAVEVEPLLEELRLAAHGRSGGDVAGAKRALPKRDCGRRADRGQDNLEFKTAARSTPSRLQGLAVAALSMLLVVGQGCSRLPDDRGPGDAPEFEGEIPAAQMHDEAQPQEAAGASRSEDGDVADDASERGNAASKLQAGVFAGRPARPERPAPNFELLDQHGQAWRPEMAQGRVLVLFFGYTHCPDICPNTMAVIRGALDRLGDDKAAGVQIALVSVDPERDTPDILGAYVSAFAPDALGLHGELTVIERVAEAYGVRFEKEYPEMASADGAASAAGSERYAVAHSGTVFLIDAYGQIRITHGGVLSPDEIAHDLSLLLDERPQRGG